MSEQLLREQLKAVLTEMRHFPAQTETEAGLYACRAELIELKLECERRRQALRIEFALSKKRKVIKTEGDKSFESVLTMFGWEKLHKVSLEIIDERESKGIEYYTNHMNQLRK
jgi:hypothetical protein